MHPLASIASLNPSSRALWIRFNRSLPSFHSCFPSLYRLLIPLIWSQSVSANFRKGQIQKMMFAKRTLFVLLYFLFLFFENLPGALFLSSSSSASLISSSSSTGQASALLSSSQSEPSSFSPSLRTFHSNLDCDRTFYSRPGGDKNGSFTAPIIENNEQRFSRQCLYTFVAAENERVQVTFNAFNLRGAHPECNHEYLDLYAEVEEPNQDLITTPFGGRYCGRYAFLHSIQSASYHLNTHHMTFK